jgi:Family of unknown function (DUF6800)
VPISERKKEIKRRRHRRKKLVELEKKLSKASSGSKLVIAEKVRALTPGAEVILKRWGIEGE